MRPVAVLTGTARRRIHVGITLPYALHSTAAPHPVWMNLNCHRRRAGTFLYLHCFRCLMLFVHPWLTVHSGDCSLNSQIPLDVVTRIVGYFLVHIKNIILQVYSHAKLWYMQCMRLWWSCLSFALCNVLQCKLSLYLFRALLCMWTARISVNCETVDKYFHWLHNEERNVTRMYNILWSHRWTMSLQIERVQSLTHCAAHLRMYLCHRLNTEVFTTILR